MRVDVESYAGYCGVEMLRRLRLGRRAIDIAEDIDRWYGPGYRYHKVKGRDGNLYILRLDHARAEWTLTMFQRPAAQGQSMALRTIRGVPT